MPVAVLRVIWPLLVAGFCVTYLVLLQAYQGMEALFPTMAVYFALVVAAADVVRLVLRSGVRPPVLHQARSHSGMREGERQGGPDHAGIHSPASPHDDEEVRGVAAGERPGTSSDSAGGTEGSEGPELPFISLARLGLAVLVGVAYLVMWDRIGFIADTVLAIGVVPVVFGLSWRRIPVALLCGVCLAVLVSYIFRLGGGAPLPEGAWLGGILQWIG